MTARPRHSQIQRTPSCAGLGDTSGVGKGGNVGAGLGDTRGVGSGGNVGEAASVIVGVVVSRVMSSLAVPDTFPLESLNHAYTVLMPSPLLRVYETLSK